MLVMELALTSTIRAWLSAAALGVLALANGCTSRTFRVDAIKSPDLVASGRAFKVVNGNPGRDDTDALVTKTAEYVKTALSAKGMYEAPDKVPANIIVEVDFGDEGPRQKVITIEEPVYRKVGETWITVTETRTNENGETETVTTRLPAREAHTVYEGWKTKVVTTITYPKFLRITAREVPAKGDDRPPREVWSVYVTNEDEDENLEKCLPLLVAAAMDAIDQNASSERTVTLRETDERVAFVKGGL